MHGGLGHFKALLQRRKERLDKTDGRFDKRKHLGKTSENKPEFNFPKLKESELEKLKYKIRFKLQRDRFKDYLLFFGIIIILSISTYYFVNYFSPKNL